MARTDSSKHLDPVVAKVHDDDFPSGRDANPAGSVEFPGSGPRGAEGVDKDPVGVEDLDPVVPGVCHHDVTLFVDGNAVGAGELARIGALATKKL